MTEGRQRRAILTSVKQAAAKLALQTLDGVGQRRLGNAATPGRAGEIAFFAEREEIANLLHFHGRPRLSDKGDAMRLDALVTWRHERVDGVVSHGRRNAAVSSLTAWLCLSS
jgi:hypothetical protein